MKPFISSPVLHGDKQGRKISYPTINLDPTTWPADHEPGVYAAEVSIGEPPTAFQGALYYGPRTIQGETNNVLEIFLLNFSQEVYGQTASFRLHKFIRPVLHFKTFDELKAEIARDVLAVSNAFDTGETETLDES